MLDLSPEKIFVIAIFAIVVLGPDRLPRAARSLARVLHQLRTASGSLQAEMRDALAEPRQVLNDAVGDLGLPTNLAIPRVPTARSLLGQVLSSPAEPAESRPFEASGAGAASEDTSLPGALPDDPSFN